jgi:hypothetical protein
MSIEDIDERRYKCRWQETIDLEPVINKKELTKIANNKFCEDEMTHFRRSGLFSSQITTVNKAVAFSTDH